MKKNYEYFEDHTDYQELDQMKKEMQDLIELRRKNKEAYKNFLEDFHKRLDKLVDEQLAN